MGLVGVGAGVGVDMLPNNGLLHGDGVLVDDRLLDNVLHRVDNIGLGNSIGLLDLNRVGAGHMAHVLNNPLNGTGNSNGHIIGDRDLLDDGVDTGLDGGDAGVLAGLLRHTDLGHCVSGARSKIDRSGRNGGSVGGGHNGEGGRGNLHGVRGGLGLTGLVRIGRGLLPGGSGMDVLVSGLDSLGTDLKRMTVLAHAHFFA